MRGALPAPGAGEIRPRSAIPALSSEQDEASAPIESPSLKTDQNKSPAAQSADPVPELTRSQEVTAPIVPRQPIRRITLNTESYSGDPALAKGAGKGKGKNKGYAKGKGKIKAKTKGMGKQFKGQQQMTDPLGGG